MNAQQNPAPAKRVSDEENERVGRNALCVEYAWHHFASEVERLRAQQSAYLAGLPTTEEAVIQASLKIVNHEGEAYPKGFVEALHLARALEAMIENVDEEETAYYHETAVFLSRRVNENLSRLRVEMDDLSDVLSNPLRLKREAR